MRESVFEPLKVTRTDIDLGRLRGPHPIPFGPAQLVTALI